MYRLGMEQTQPGCFAHCEAFLKIKFWIKFSAQLLMNLTAAVEQKDLV